MNVSKLKTNTDSAENREILRIVSDEAILAECLRRNLSMYGGLVQFSNINNQEFIQRLINLIDTGNDLEIDRTLTHLEETLK